MEFVDYSNCKDEQQFKRKFIEYELKTLTNKVFCIETEETVKGFPDVMVVFPLGNNKGCLTYFYEFKISDKNGKIKFQPTQLSFYKRNKDLAVKVVAYNRSSNRVHNFSAENIFDDNSPYKMNEMAVVNLNKAEEGDFIV